MASDRDRLPVLPTLLVLTFLSGVVDAVCYLGLGHVFTANMTGNIVVLGFAAAGAPGFSASACLTSLGVFLVGAVAGGWLSLRIKRHSKLLSAAMLIEASFVAAAAVVAYLAPAVGHGWARYTVIAILAFAMGIRNSVIRRLAIPDMNTTVLTMTLTGLAADSPLAGGQNIRTGRRALAVLAMLAGAAIGAALFLHIGAWLPLAISAAAAALTTVAFWRGQGPEALDAA